MKALKNFMSNLVSGALALVMALLIMAGILSFVPGPKFERTHKYSVSVSSDDSSNLLDLVKTAKVVEETEVHTNWTTDNNYSMLAFIREQISEGIVAYANSKSVD